MMLRIGTIARRKVLAILLMAAMLVSLLPAGLTAAEDVGATLIQSGDYTISADGIYRLANGYSGIITIAPKAYGVTLIGSTDGKNHPNTSIIVEERPLPFQLIIKDLKISAPDGKPGIDFGNASGVNYSEKWPFNLNNAEQPALYYLANLLRFGGDCSVTGSSGRAGVYVGEGVLLMIDKVPGQTDAQARLTAVGGAQGAGIGGDRGFSGGSVAINGGTITATGGDTAAGLGCLAGTITINGGTITATGGISAPGLGNTSYTVTRVLERYNLKSSSLVIPGETIIINGGTVTAVGNGDSGIYALGGIKLTQDTYSSNNIRKSMLGRLTVNGGSVTASGKESFTGISGRHITITGGVVSAFSSNGPGINGVETTINGGTVVAAGGSTPNELLEFVNDGLGMLKDTMNSSEEFKNSQEAALDFKELENTFKSWADLLISSFLGSGGGGAGIGLYPGDNLTINDGIIIARGGPSSAGIGGSVMGGLMGMFTTGQDQTPGPITIKGGLISATGGSGAAGIGGGFNQKAERITISGNPTVIATRGSDGAQDIGSGEGGPETLIKDQSGKTLSYIRMEVKDKTSGQPLPDKKIMVDGNSYFSNKDGLLGFFVPLRVQSVKGGSSRLQTKIMVTALASSVFPGAVTEIIPSEQNIRSTIELDFYLQNISLLGISKDNADGVPLQSTPAYDPLQANYAMEVDNAVTSLKIIPERVAGDSVTAVQVNGSQVRAGEAVLVPLQIGENNILLTLTLSDDEWAADAVPLQKAYLFKVTRTNMKNLPSLMLLESNQPLDEGSVFKARYTFKLPEAAIGVAQKISADGNNTIPAPDLTGSTWPGIWTGIWRGTVDYGDGSDFQAIVLREDGSFDLEHRYADDGRYKVNISFWYEDSGQVTDSLEVTVKNVVPTLTVEGLQDEITIKEGEQLTITGSIVDPGSDRWTVTGDFGSPLGPKPAVLQDKTFTFQETFSDTKITYAPNSTFETQPERDLILKVSDDEGGVWQKKIKVKVKNIAPSVDIGKWAIIQEGKNFSRLGSFSDPGMDNWQGTVDYGDGSKLQPLELLPDKTFKLSHTYNTSGIYKVTVRITDHPDKKNRIIEEETSKVPRIPDQSADQLMPEQTSVNLNADTAVVKLESVQALISTAVTAAPDHAAAASPEPESWGVTSIASFELKVKDYIFFSEVRTDASVTEGEKFAGETWIYGPAVRMKKYTIDYGDGSQEERTVDFSDGRQILTIAKISHSYADDGTYPVTIYVEDVDGDVYEESFQVVVANAAPEVSVKSNDRYTTNETFTCSGSFSDPGSDSWKATVDFGDGGGPRELQLKKDKSFSVSHSYKSPGSYTITVTVSDDDGGIGRATREVLVRNKGASSDANLYSMILGVPFAPDFDKNVTNYTITGPAGGTPLTVTAHPLATIRYRVTPNPVFTVIEQNTMTIIDIIGGDLFIQVTAENGNTKTYTFDNTPDD